MMFRAVTSLTEHATPVDSTGGFGLKTNSCNPSRRYICDIIRVIDIVIVRIRGAATGVELWLVRMMCCVVMLLGEERRTIPLPSYWTKAAYHCPNRSMRQRDRASNIPSCCLQILIWWLKVSADCFVVAHLCLNELQCSGYKYKPEHSAAATAEVAFNASECVIICLEFINDFVAV